MNPRSKPPSLRAQASAKLFSTAFPSAPPRKKPTPTASRPVLHLPKKGKK